MAEKIAERRAQEQDERFQRLLEDPEANLEKLEVNWEVGGGRRKPKGGNFTKMHISSV